MDKELFIGPNAGAAPKKEEDWSKDKFVGYWDTQGSIMPPPRTFVFDIDGIICSYKCGTEFKEAIPLVDNIDLIQKLYYAGHRIILFTARTKKYKRITLKQLQEWDVHYHALFFNKPDADYYVDDRSASTDNLRNLLYMGEL